MADTKVVPREPTTMMLAAACRFDPHSELGLSDYAALWRAMYEAAPPAERPSVADEVDWSQLAIESSLHATAELRAERDDLRKRLVVSTHTIWDISGRAEKAESELDALRAQVAERDESLQLVRGGFRWNVAEYVGAVAENERLSAALRACEAELEAARKDAELHEQVMRAARELPDGWQIFAQQLRAAIDAALAALAAQPHEAEGK